MVEKEILNPSRNADKEWYLALLDEAQQKNIEEDHLRAVLSVLRSIYLSRYQKCIRKKEAEAQSLKKKEGYSAEDYKTLLQLNAEIDGIQKKLDTFKCFFTEPYFARMDVVDQKEGYNSYYIGKKGDVNLEIVDWRAPLAVRYYQKSRVQFRINDYEYKTVLRRALSVKNGKLLGFKNEYLSVKDVLSSEEIAGRDEEILFDPYLKSILENRKGDTCVRDIIRTIQEKQFEVITRPERETFVLQGCAGSGKTMILLHRLSYLMYNNESLSPRDVLVITPSDSFNAFIDELSQVLELQKVRTTTLQSYYFRILKNEGVELEARLCGKREDEAYLTFLYSREFAKKVEREIEKLYDDIYGLFASEECREVTKSVLADFQRRQEKYVKIKNSSVRVRKCVLGEMKEKKDGGFYFTKPFRMLMGAFTQAEDFLKFVLHEEKRPPFYFFRQFTGFFHSAKEITLGAENVFEKALSELKEFQRIVEKEISDLKRYRRRLGDEEILTYQDRIQRRVELMQEVGETENLICQMSEGIDLFKDFFKVLKMTDSCMEVERCENDLDLLRWLYRKTVKKYKLKYGMKGMYPSDGYALCMLLTAAGKELKPRFGLVFVDEGQDISPSEYDLLRRIHGDAAFNVFGDLKQNITPWRGVKEWDESFGEKYELSRNYRNTNEIVDFVSGLEGVSMTPVGLHGEAVKNIKLRSVSSFFRNKEGLKAVITREEHLPLFQRRGFSLLSEAGKLYKSKINVLTVYESKGLEFSAVAVYDAGMTENEKYIAYTRALFALAVVSEET